MNPEFRKHFVERHTTTYERAADEEAIRQYEGVLPANLIGIWQLGGWSAYFDGLLWFVDPRVYAGVLEDFLEDTGLEGDFHVVAKSAFGDLIAYETRSGSFITVNAVFGRISVNRRKLSREASNNDADLSVMSKFVMFDPGTDGDIKTDNGESIFKYAYERLGHLEPDEIYGFEPLLSLGGPEPGNVRRVKDVVHLSIISQMVSVRLWEF